MFKLYFMDMQWNNLIYNFVNKLKSLILSDKLNNQTENEYNEKL